MAYSPNSRRLWLELAFVLINTLCFYAECDGVANDPVQIVANALSCFNDHVVYVRCNYEYRLTASGDLNIPEAATDAYCSGACMEETDLVLSCIDRIMDNFEFYNRATIRDIRDTIRDGCSQTPRRGHFSVAEHMQAEADKAIRVFHPRSFVLTLLVLSLTALLLSY